MRIDQSKLDGIIARLMEYSGTQNPRQLSLWLGHRDNYISKLKSDGRISTKMLMEMIPNRADIEWILEGGERKQQSKVTPPEPQNDREFALVFQARLEQSTIDYRILVEHVGSKLEAPDRIMPSTHHEREEKDQRAPTVQDVAGKSPSG